MAQFVVKHNHSGHHRPYDDQAGNYIREVPIESCKEMDLNRRCSFIIGWVWNGDDTLAANPYWRMFDAKLTEDGAICELRWIGGGTPPSSHFIHVRGEIGVTGPW